MQAGRAGVAEEEQADAVVVRLRNKSGQIINLEKYGDEVENRNVESNLSFLMSLIKPSRRGKYEYSKTITIVAGTSHHADAV